MQTRPAVRTAPIEVQFCYFGDGGSRVFQISVTTRVGQAFAVRDEFDSPQHAFETGLALANDPCATVCVAEVVH